MTDEEVDFLIDAILFVAEYGRRFLPLYTFDVRTGAWRFRAETAISDGLAFGIDEALATGDADVHAAHALAAPHAHTGPHAHTPSHAEMSPACSGVGPAWDALERASIERRRGYVREAQRLADELFTSHPNLRLRCTKKDLIPFVYA
jgi:hypothetical protein